MTLLSTAPTEADTHFASAAMPAEAAARTMPTLAPVTIIEKEGYRFMHFVGCEGVTQGALRLSDPMPSISNTSTSRWPGCCSWSRPRKAIST